MDSNATSMYTLYVSKNDELETVKEAVKEKERELAALQAKMDKLTKEEQREEKKIEAEVDGMIMDLDSIRDQVNVIKKNGGDQNLLQEYEAVLSTSSHEDENARLRKARTAARESKRAKLKAKRAKKKKALEEA